jgi:hypothetical protein
MSEQLGLDRFLSSLGEGGEYVQTSEFTLNTLKAREKLSQYQLSDSGLWLVKLVQAAVASGAPDVRIQFGKRHVTVQFENCQKFRAGALLQSVLSGEIPSDRVLLHLVTGLRASATLSSEMVRWSCGTERAVLSGDGSAVEMVQEQSYLLVECNRPSRQRSFKNALTSSVYHLAKETVEEFNAVRSRCWSSPIPIFLDGKDMDRGYGLVEAGKVETSPWEVLMKHERSRNSVVKAVLAVASLPTQHEELSLPFNQHFSETAEPIIGKPLYKGDTFLQYPPTEHRSAAVVVLTSGFNAPTCVDYVLDGAMVFREDLELEISQTKVFGIEISGKPCMGIRLVVPVGPEALDLGQFKVRDTNPREVAASCVACVRGLARVLVEHRSGFWYVPISRPFAKLTGLAVGGQVALMLAVTKGAVAVLLPFAAVGTVGGNTAIWRKYVFDGVERLVQSFERFVSSSLSS